MLLLVVLSMLVLFLMIGTAFIITAKQSQQAAKNQTKANQSAANQAALGNLLDEVLLQLVRDTDNPQSALRSHSLLGDMYGNDGFKSQIPNTAGAATWARDLGPNNGNTDPLTGEYTGAGSKPGGITGGALVQFKVNAAVDLFNQPSPLSPVDNAYSGQLVTFLSGPAKGVSTRIVGYSPTVGGAGGVTEAVFTVVTFPLSDGSPLDDPNKTGDGPALIAGARILVNGRPFNGTGVGFDPTHPANFQGPLLNASEMINGVPYPIALLPNAAFFQPANMAAMANGDLAANRYFEDQLTFSDYAGRGGPDETYDAPDFQNFALAFLQDQPEDQTRPAANPGDPGSLDDMVLPSFHRPELMAYWQAQISASGDTLANKPAVLRRIMARPTWFDHPLFTGSNPNLTPWIAQFRQQYINAVGDLTDTNLIQASQRLIDASQRDELLLGPWDVDNDNDGNRDSVWIDFGAPVMTGPNGKRVKPMAAILMIDMDGRVNLNTAGTRDLALRANNAAAATGLASLPLLAEAQMSGNTPRGVGWGPAEISVESVLNDQRFRRLFDGAGGGGTLAVPGRLGSDQAPGVGNALDFMTQINKFAWPQWGAQRGTTFAMPPDLRARYGAGINDYGQMVFEATFASERPVPTDINVRPSALTSDSPYEATLMAEGIDTVNSVAAADAPFSLGELEKVLRAYDTDGVALPTRLDRFGIGIDPHERNRITTDSWSIPSPLIALPSDLRTMVAPPSATSTPRPPQSAADLLEIRIRNTLWPSDPTKYFPVPLTGDPNDPTTDAGKVRRIVRQLLAPELAAGLHLDVNRAIGNGRDDTTDTNAPGYGVVDEYGEEEALTGPQRLLWSRMINGQTTTGAVAGNPDSLTPQNARAMSQYANARFMPLDVDPLDGQNILLDTIMQRQLLARHLYVTALALCAPPDFGTSATPTDADRRLAERVAQWAINVVDFRDADGIMTAFEYDINPFAYDATKQRAWRVNGLVGDKMPGDDGIPGTSDDDSNLPAGVTADDNEPYRAVVWGTERPELLITETFAFHNRNVTDESDEDPNPGEEPGDSSDPLNEPNGEFDQKYRPRGAFYLELYNPWPAMPSVSADLHATTTNANGEGVDLGVDLAARIDNGAGNPSAVWRLMVYRDNQIENLDPDDPDPRRRPRQPDRSVYFAGFDPGLNDDGVAFYNDPADQFARTVPPVRPGRYLVVGSGTETAPRSGEYLNAFGSVLAPMSQANRPPLRGIMLNAQIGQTTDPPVRLLDYVGGNSGAAAIAMLKPVAPATGRDVPMAPPLESAAAADPNTRLPQLQGNSQSKFIADVAVINQPRRLSISEPAGGYPNSVGNVAWVPRTAAGVPAAMNDPGEDGYYALGNGRQNGVPQGEPTQPKAIDTPLDTGDPALATIGTTYNYRQVFLQRLANPLAPYDPVANPYRTVDRASVNITTFSGRLRPTERDNGQQNSQAREGFSSLERGFRGRGQNAKDAYNIWSTQPIDNQGTIRTDRSRAASARAGTNAAVPYSVTAVPPVTLGFVNRVFFDNAAATAVETQVRPDDPFPWLAWNNRPYISGNELMLVPFARSSQLLNNFTMADDSNQSPYKEPVNLVTANPQRDPRKVVNEGDVPPFIFLENFLYDEAPQAATQQTTQPSRLYRVLDLVGTPSLYPGATTWFNPQYFSNLTPDATDPRYNRLAPFNTVSSYREPGKINLNTIGSSAVYAGLFHDKKPDASDVMPEPTVNSVHPGPRWSNNNDSFVRSRRGYGAAGDDMLQMDPAIPTFFANPFRSADSGQLVPVQAMIRKGVECTLLRSTSATANVVDDDPLFVADTKTDHNHAERNAFFRYQPAVRLNNLVTTQSNVYAVWITIGFFEVEELRDNDPLSKAVIATFKTTSGNPASTLAEARQDPMFYRVYPEGFMLGKEAGLDEGNVRRLRGFYVIDRSRPAPYQPGRDLGVENVIRLRRHIE